MVQKKRPNKGLEKGPCSVFRLCVIYFVGDFGKCAPPAFLDVFRRDVHLLGDLCVGFAIYVALDEACHLVGWKLEGTDICHGPPRGHCGNLCADVSMLRVHTVTKGLQNAVAREVAELRPFPFCPNRAQIILGP